jgi:hypothetical protein
MPSRLLYGFSHLIVAVQVEHVRDEIQRILVVLHLRIEPREVEPVRQVILVDLAKVLVAS